MEAQLVLIYAWPALFPIFEGCIDTLLNFSFTWLFVLFQFMIQKALLEDCQVY